MRLFWALIGCILLWTPVTSARAEHYLVRTQSEYAAAAQRLNPGDVIILANGVWRDFEIVLNARGTREQPIVLISETAGRVILSGRSNLRIGGEHLIISGLVFRDGYSPTSEVISFRRDSRTLASNTRVTQVVIDHFNNPDRSASDHWVAMYGQNNQFDHNFLVGKSNEGVTLAVRLDNDASRNNNHRIDHNYFGPRPPLGSNGGETIRIGTSDVSMFRSATIIEDNVFDRCSGEVEIISVKSAGNIVRRNLFLESAGTVTLRHGDDNLVERNIFMGRGQPHTGGVRIINRNQIVRNNYMEGLRGTGFASALTVMNGVPNSPVNRYVQVSNALIEHNSVIDAAQVALAAGADAERSAPPIDSELRANLFSFATPGRGVTGEDSVAGISFADNIVASAVLPDTLAMVGRVLPDPVDMERAANGLLYPTDPGLADIGAPRDLRMISLDEVGPDWYPKPGPDALFGTGRTISVDGTADALVAAVAGAENGDTLQLASGDFAMDRTLVISKTLTITGPASSRPRISFSAPSLFEIAEGGNLRLENLEISGSQAPDSAGNSVIRTTGVGGLANFDVEMTNVAVTSLVVNRAFHMLALGKGALANRVTIDASSFDNVSGSVVHGTAENDDLGRYNVEYLTIRNSRFERVQGPVVALYRGGNDESTFGPHVTFAANQVSGSGGRIGSNEPAALLLIGVQDLTITGSRFQNSAPIRFVRTTGRPLVRMNGNSYVSTPAPVLTDLSGRVLNCTTCEQVLADGASQ